MKCEEARNTLPLFLYGELSFEEEERLELHIDECAGCRIALERERSLFKSLDAAELTPSRELLENCRAELRSRLAQVEPERGAFWDKLRQGFSIHFHFAPGWTQAAGLLAMLVLGFLAARMTPGSFPTPWRSASLVAEPVSSRVRYVEPTAAGKVQIVIDEMQCCAVVGCISRRESAGDQGVIIRPALGLAIVMRTRAASEKTQTIRKGCERSKRIRDARLEPADHPRADPAQHRAAVPCGMERPIDPVRAPQREQVRRVAATDVDHVLVGDERRELGVGRGPAGEAGHADQRQVGRDAVARRERAIEPRDVGRGIATRGRKETHARLGQARAAEDEIVEERRFLHRESTPAEPDDLTRHPLDSSG